MLMIRMERAAEIALRLSQAAAWCGLAYLAFRLGATL